MMKGPIHKKTVYNYKMKSHILGCCCVAASYEKSHPFAYITFNLRFSASPVTVMKSITEE